MLLTTGLVLGLSAAPANAAEPVIVDSTKHGGRTVSFTFDDGPNPADTPRLLAILRQHHVKAVFCLWGDFVVENPDVVRQIVRGGHILCNHSMHHDNMGEWTPEQIEADLKQTSEAIRDAVPGVPIRYFRAPYGSWGQTPQVAAKLGMTPLGWKLAIGDWEPPGVDELVRRVKEGLTEGAVVLMHDGPNERGQTVDAVARLIPELRADGWRFDRPARR
ncbi:polysaccharide deacetylase family protein [Saccharothrix carnea]|uniref:polysaccharide deacetylase family protein n=1 Tax=Saccharothrix carnea TaxID=1280637 RepID=UPI001FE5BBEE|nr:polysaccharide deacetylase family protein [Saccharothrix carnea]